MFLWLKPTSGQSMRTYTNGSAREIGEAWQLIDSYGGTVDITTKGATPPLTLFRLNLTDQNFGEPRLVTEE